MRAPSHVRRRPERHRRLSRVFASRLLPNPTRHVTVRSRVKRLTSVSPKRAKSESRGRSNGATLDQSYMLLPVMFGHSGILFLLCESRGNRSAQHLVSGFANVAVSSC
jgi:hypothetical protein